MEILGTPPGRGFDRARDVPAVPTPINAVEAIAAALGTSHESLPVLSMAGISGYRGVLEVVLLLLRLA